MAHHQPGLEVVVHAAPEVDRREQPECFVYQEPYGPSSGAEDVNITVPVTTPESYFKPQEEKSRVLSRRSLWLVVAFGVLIVIIAVIGGLLGGLLSRRGSTDGEKATGSSPLIESSGTSILPSTTTIASSSSSSSSSSLTSSTASPMPSESSSPTTSPVTAFPTSGTLSLDCPSLDGTEKIQEVSNQKYTFEIYCGSDGHGSQAGGPAYSTYTIDDCMNQCATFNAGGGSDHCAGVVWNGNLTSALIQGGNCYFSLRTMELVSCDNCLLAAAAKLVE